MYTWKIVPSLDGQARRQLALLGNVAMFAAEVWSGFAYGSSALHASALDFVADATLYASSLSGIAVSARPRSALLASSVVLGLGVAVLAGTVYRLAAAPTPHGSMMGFLGLLALLLHGTVTRVLMAEGGAVVARKSQDVLQPGKPFGTLAAIAAAAGVCVSGSRWPDLATGWIVA